MTGYMTTNGMPDFQTWSASKGSGTASSAGVVSGSPWTVYGVSQKQWQQVIPDFKDQTTASMQMPLGGAQGEHSGARSGTRAPQFTAGQILQYVGAGGPDSIAALQAQLWHTGSYAKVKASAIHWGTLDKRTVTALVGVMNGSIKVGAGGKRTTWQEYLYGLPIKNGGYGDGSSPSGRSGGSSQPRDTTQTSVNLSNQDQAQGYLDAASQSLLGRAATAAEAAKFHGYLNSKEKAAPNVTKTHYSAGGSSTSSTSAGGVDGGMEAQAFAPQGHEQEHDQFAVGQYMNTFQSLLGGSTG